MHHCGDGTDYTVNHSGMEIKQLYVTEKQILTRIWRASFVMRGSGSERYEWRSRVVTGTVKKNNLFIYLFLHVFMYLFSFQKKFKDENAIGTPDENVGERKGGV